MITTAVHQASQMVEIQGAPPAAPASGDDFRATFAASVGDTAAQNSVSTRGQTELGTASAAAFSKHPLLAALAKTPSPSANAALEDSQKLEDAGSGESATGVETETLADLKAVSDGSLKSAAVDTVSTDASNAAAEARVASTALAVAAIPLRTGNADSASLQAAVAASGLVASAGVAKDREASQTTPGTAVHGRKEETGVSSKDTGAGSASAAVLGAASAGGEFLDTAAVAVPAVHLDTQANGQARTPDGGSITEPGTKAGVLTSVLEASDGASGLHGSPVRPGNGGDLPDAVTGLNSGLNQSASLPQGTFAATVATEGLGSLSKSARPDPAAGVGSKGRLESDSMVSEVQTAASEGGSATAGSIAAAAPASIEASLRSVAGSAQKSVSAVKNAGVKSTSSIELADAVPATQVRAIAQPHPVSGTLVRAASQTVVLKTAGTVPAQLAGAERRDSTSSAVPTSAVAAPAALGGPAIATSGEVKLAPQPDAVRDAGAAPLSEASSRTGVAVTKDEKTKSVTAGSDDTASGRSAAQSVAGDPSNALGNAAGTGAGTASGNVSGNATANFAAGAANLAGRVVAAADAAVPSAQATAHLAGAMAHDIAAAAGPAGSGRGVGSVSAGLVAEQSSSLAGSAEPHRTLLATPTTLEVGVPSGTQGWLRIRAEVGAPGEVNASLSAASSGGRDLLHSQMPALNAFLHSEQLAVTATLAERGTGISQSGAAFGSGGLGSGGLGSGGLGSGGLGSDASGGSNASLLHGGGAQSGESQREAGNVTGSDLVPSYAARSAASEATGTLSSGTSTSGDSGRWLNVRV